MEDYAYEARNNSGELVSGLVVAESVEQASAQLIDRELFVVRLTAGEERARAWRLSGPGRATRPQVAWFMSQLSIMVESGIPLSEAINSVMRQASDARLRSLLEAVSKKVEAGAPFSQALAEYPDSFPPTLTSLVSASESNGSLGEVLNRSSSYLLNDLQTLRKIRGALTYPLCLFVLSLAVMVFLLAVILPRFAEIFADRGDTLPAITRYLMGASEVLVTYWFECSVGAVVAGMLVVMWSYSPTGRRQRDTLLLKIPVINSVMQGLYQSRSFRTIALLIQTGVPLMDVIVIAKDLTSNTHYRRLWTDVEEQVRNGNPLSTPLLNSKIIPEPVAQMIEAGERSGRLGQVLGRLSDFIEEEYNQTLKTAMQLIEPAMILLIGVVIGVIAAALMLPMFQASSMSP